MSLTTLTHEQPVIDHQPLIIEQFLRNRDEVWQQIKLEYRLDPLIKRMLVSSAIPLACYGAVIGLGRGELPQVLSSALKLPLIFLLTLAICLPTLYLFNLLYGGRLSARQALALVLVAITVSSNLTLALVPISLFFLITAQSYAFFLLLNVVILALTGCVGLYFLIGGAWQLNALARAEDHAGDEQAPKPGKRPDTINMHLLRIWLMLYAFVGVQLSWTLRPILGEPDKPFMLFHPIQGDFFSGLLEILLRWGR